MSKTPTKSDLINQFRARDISTPNKDKQGIDKTVHSHVSRLHVLLSDWVKMKDKGIRAFKAVKAFKLHECSEDYYPSQLIHSMQSLLEIMEKLKVIVSSYQLLSDQLQALAKLQPNNDPIISTWSISHISKNVIDIVESLEKEYKLKEVVIDNVAHCRDEQLLDVYITAWEYDVYLNFDSFAYLFAEVGLPGLS